MDIKPPKNWKQPQTAKPISPTTQSDPIDMGQVNTQTSSSVKKVLPPVIIPEDGDVTAPPKQKSRRWIGIVASIVALVLICIAAGFGWYVYSLQPRDVNASLQAVTVEEGMTPRSIAQLLEEKQIIRSTFVFELYTSIGGYAGSLQAGNYKLGASQSVADIVTHLTKGVNDVYNVTILPGLTLKELADPTIKKSLVAQGFGEDEVAAALNAEYSSPVLADRPTGASLEGYIFPETYQLRVGDTLESLIQRSLDELYAQLQSGAMIDAFTQRGLTIHQAMTLASIVQQEVSNPDDQSQVAQVFLRRIAEGMMLGSDVTALYGAQIDGIELPDDAAAAAVIAVNYDSPYNTRMHTGLPPGPIANMNLSALKAVASPAAGEYLFFVAGDDGRTYFSKTNAEHEAAVAAHCHTLCGR